MTEMDVEIKVEPMDEEYSEFKEEEFIIKTEIDIEDTSCNPTKVPNSFFTPKKKSMNFQDYYTKAMTIPDRPSILQCHVCRRYFCSESSLCNHKCLGKESRENKLTGDNPRKRLQCDSCKQTFLSDIQLFYHNCKNPKQAYCTNSKEDDKRLRGRIVNTCTICGQTFRTQYIYEEHMQFHRNKLKRSPKKERKPMCIMPKSLLDPKVMVFACNLCDISFSTAKGLQNHNTVHGGYEHICKQCGKSFKCAIDLKTHTIGDTCTRESVADFLGSCGSESSIDIKTEVESDGDTPMEPEEKRSTSYRRAKTALSTDTCINDIDLLQLPVDGIPQKKNAPIHDKHHILMSDRASTALIMPQQSVPFDTQRNAFILSNKSQLKPLYAPQRLDVILDGLGNAFVMKKEDLVTGTLQFPQIKTYKNEQVVLDAQGNAFQFSQQPAIMEPQLPLAHIPQRQDVSFIAQDHCYTKTFPLIVEVKEEPAELEIEPPSDPMNCEDINTNEASELTIKEEPAFEIEGEPASDPINYEDLLIEELFDRKAKSMAKERKAAMETMETVEVEVPPEDGDSESIETELLAFENTDFEEAIASNRLEIPNNDDLLSTTVKEEPRDDVAAEESSNDCAVEMDPHSVEDFEEMIDSTTVPHMLVKCEIIEDMRDEYQKAKKKKLDDSSADESSRGPYSVFVSLSESRKFYNVTIRKLDKRYRYIWICSKCPKQYIQRHSFVKHQLTTHYKDLSEFKGELFELRPELLAENITVEGYCNVCRVTLADAVTLQKHKKEIHAQDDNASKIQFRCHKCGKFCSSRSTLGDHIHSDCGKNPQYGCEVCGKKFYSRSTLQLHKTMHTGELPFKCTYCEKRVRTRGQLTVHTRTHTGERPFPCKVCERRFTHRETLISHLSRHIDMKRYKCNGCDALFASISGLKTHRDNRIHTCGKFKFNSRPIGPRVRVIKGNVIFEPQPKFNPYSRENNNGADGNTQKNDEAEETDDNTKENANLLENINQVANTKPNAVVEES